jgi:DEAD/DEAH box helicase domain-containing protein
MSLADLFEAWRTDPEIGANVAAWRTFAARPGQVVPFPGELHPALASALRAAGIEALYAHQTAAWEGVQSGQNTVIATGTASGKTLCYNLPVLDDLLRDSGGRALYLFPTKALTQDQKSALEQLVQGCGAGLPVGTYDGDTPSAARSAIRQRARVVFSNPDMLSAGVLPHHPLWADLFANLRFVVIDEMHTYRGVFGSHVANVLRRLKRVARSYGSSPRFILTSATIGNPVELAERLIEEPVVLIDDDGAARGARHFLIYNPPVVDADLGLRRSMLLECVRLSAELLEYGVQTIVFARTRQTVELILSYLRAGAGSVDPESERWARRQAPDAIRGYRSGYLPRQRREIERGLREGRVRAVVSTSALELGMDIGGMGAAVLAGYPGSIAATWQRAGRAGRTDRPALAALVASPAPLDQFLAHHPDYFFERSPEQALIDPDNTLILLGHLKCAAFELPFGQGEGFGRVDGKQVAEYLHVLEEAGFLHRSGQKTFWLAEGYPARDLNLRSASPDSVLLRVQEDDGWRTIGQVDKVSAAWMVHPQAVYLHEGQTYLVEELDLDQGQARLRPVVLDYYTQPRQDTTVQLVERRGALEGRGACKAYGEIVVTTQVTGYRQIRWFTQEQIGMGEVALPPAELLTTAYWLTPSEDTVARLREQGAWSNDANDYGSNWRVQRDRARERDGYRCQVCGVLEEGRAHHVHHKVPFRSCASYRQANQLSNLVTLCPRCHLRVEQAVRMRSGLSGLAFVLGHLAPLFLMCDAGDLGVHADPQSPLADNRPTVAVYDQIPGGIGFARRLFDLHEELLARAYEWVSACECANGCPSCVGPAGEHGVGGKQETLALLEALCHL